MPGNRDDFSESTKTLLAKRAGFRCSNPSCRKPTSGSNVDPNKATNIGVAAHICAAALGGPRYDSEMTPEERKSPQNGIWLCQSCSKLIDSDSLRYSKETLNTWKKIAETVSALELERPSAANISSIDHGTTELQNNRWFIQRDKHSSVSFGYKSVDDFCKLTDGSVVLISGYIGIDIDIFVQNVVLHNLKTDSRVIYFNLKESSNTIINSMIAAESYVKTNNIRTGKLTENEWNRIALAATSLERCQLIFEPYDSGMPSMVPYFLSSIKNGNADIIVLDDLDGLGIEDTASLNKFLYQMRNAAIQSGTTVFILLNFDELPKRMDKRPILNDPKVNKLVKFCDVIQLLYHNDDHILSNSETKLLELTVAKSYLSTQSERFYFLHLTLYSMIVEFEQTAEKRKGVFEKYPGVVAGIKSFADCLENL